MVSSQASTYETVGQRMSSEDVELTNLDSFGSGTHKDDHTDLSNHHGFTTPSMEALHQPLASGHSETASQIPLQLSADSEYFSAPADSEHKSAIQRIGTYSVIGLVATTILMLAVFSFITFFWTAAHENSFWRSIIVSGWGGGAVTVSSLLLRTAADLQAGVAVAMLAAMFLESGHVLLIDSAQVSKLRAGRAASLDIKGPGIRSVRYQWPRRPGYLVRGLVVLVLVATTTLLQLTSTILVSDLSVGPLAGMALSENLKYDFTYEWDQSNLIWSQPRQYRAAIPWSRNPPAFPTFAEFSEPIDVPEHVDETGRLLRAFLPFQDAQSRETISHYSGKALVLDARVSCQRPQFLSLYIERNGSSFSYVGTFSKTEEVRGLLGSASSVPFNCQFNLFALDNSLSICQPSGFRYGDGKLMSELRNGEQWSRIAESWSHGSLSIDDRPNAAYLIFNSTSLNFASGRNITVGNPSATSGHGAWSDVSYLPAPPSSENFPWYMDVSVTLCYPAIWTARLNVTLHSPHNRTEPSASSFNTSFRTVPDIHAQMGEFRYDYGKAYAIRPQLYRIYLITNKA
jgi:hypothetical protein